MKRKFKLSIIVKSFILTLMLLINTTVYARTPVSNYEVEKYQETTLYYNGTIITVDDKYPLAEAVMVGDGKIIAVGEEKDLLLHKGKDTKLVNLNGKTMLPGFIDAHSHITMVEQYADFSPAQGIISNDTLIHEGKNIFKTWYETSVMEGTYEEGDWFVGTGYDNTSFPDAVHPTADILDEISTEIPICIIHTSNHMAVVNHKGLEILGYFRDSDFTNAFGDYVGKDSEGNPTGILKEDAFFRLYFEPNVLLDHTKTNSYDAVKLLENAMNTYASYGITTAQEGGGNSIESVASELVESGKEMIIDIGKYNSDLQKMVSSSEDAEYINGIKQAGIKIILDGSPQAKTAWLNEPYYIAPEGQDDNYKGFPAMTDEDLYEKLLTCVKNGYQVLVHVNGTAAIDQFITQYEKVKEDTGITTDLRPVLIHAQTITEEQLDRVESVGMDISFFHDHTYYWGDYHMASVLGPERGSRISPLKTALERDINITIHQDTPVVPPNMLFSIHNAVNRITRDGQSIGKEYAVDVMTAIKLVTINGAMQYFEEDLKGSIEVGKLADFVILNENPLEVPIETLKDIKVLKTIKEDKIIYTNDMYEDVPVVEVKTAVYGSTIGQEYKIIVPTHEVDLSKLEILYTADNMKTDIAQLVNCDYAALQLDKSPWHMELTNDVEANIVDNVLHLKLNTSAKRIPHVGLYKLNLRISKVDWSLYDNILNEKLEIYYNGKKIDI